MKNIIYLIAFLIGFNYGKTNTFNHTDGQLKTYEKIDVSVTYCSNYVYDYYNKVDVSNFCEISNSDAKK